MVSILFRACFAGKTLFVRFSSKLIFLAVILINTIVTILPLPLSELCHKQLGKKKRSDLTHFYRNVDMKKLREIAFCRRWQRKQFSVTPCGVERGKPLLAKNKRVWMEMAAF
jgi:hypothetical protein